MVPAGGVVIPILTCGDMLGTAIGPILDLIA